MSALVDNLLDFLRGQPLIKSVRVINLDESPAGSLEAKIRCKLAEEYQLQIWLHHDSDSEDYAYQLFTDKPILRWDNAPHYPHIATAPHHFHDEKNKVSDSPLTGKPLKDIKRVMIEIEKWLTEKKNEGV